MAITRTPLHDMATELYPDHFDLHFAIRPNILAFPKYTTSTSDETQSRPAIILDANENSAGCCLATSLPSTQDAVDLSHLNRYPSASQQALRQAVVQYRQLKSIDQLCLGSGASDVIDLIIRATCVPSRDKILITPPTFELYRVCAALHDVEVHSCGQILTSDGDFCIPTDEICTALSLDNRIKVVMLASPGNPTGSLIPLAALQQLLELKAFRGLVVVDEAYIDFHAAAEQVSALNLVPRYNNLVVVQSLSKSHGLAGIRIGMAIAHPVIAGVLAKVQMPYKISSLTLELACHALSQDDDADQHRVRNLRLAVMANRSALLQSLAHARFARRGVGRPIGGNVGNFIVVPILSCSGAGPGPVKPDDARAMQIVQKLRWDHDVAIRYIGAQAQCAGCVRITVGNTHEIQALLSALDQVLNEC